MSDLQAFRSAIAGRKEYLNRVVQPTESGDSMVMPYFVEMNTDHLGQPQTLLSFTRLSSFLNRTSDREKQLTSAFLKNLLREGHFNRTPHPQIKRPLDGSPAESVSVPYLDADGGFGSVLITGDDIPVIAPTFKAGWNLHPFTVDESSVCGRYVHWRKVYEAQRILGNEPIPPKTFLDEPNEAVESFLAHLLTLINPNWQETPFSQMETLEWLVDWLLWGLGHPCSPNPPDPNRWTEDAHSKVYQIFSAIPFLLYPYDYFGDFLAKAQGQSRMSQAKVEQIIENLFPYKHMDHRHRLIVDPDVGTGRLLMQLGSHSYNIFGMQRVPTFGADWLAVKIAILNCYFHAPWVVCPFTFLIDQEPSDRDLKFALGQTLDIIRSKRLEKNYFSATENDFFAFNYLPIQIRRDREPDVLPATPIEIMPPVFEGYPTFAGSSPFDALPQSQVFPAVEGASVFPAMEGSVFNNLPPGSVFSELRPAQENLLPEGMQALPPAAQEEGDRHE